MFGFIDHESKENVFLALIQVVMVKERDDGTGMVTMVDGSWYNLIPIDTNRLLKALKDHYGNEWNVG